MINPLLKLTYRELEVFSLLLKYDLDINMNLRKPMSPTELRRQIMSETCVNKNNLSKYINVFTEKKLVFKDMDTGMLKVNEVLLPILNDNLVEINYILTVE